MSSTSIFLTGASGYIGGSVLHALLESPNASNYTISALVRSPDHIAKVKALGVRVVQGSLDDLDLLEKEAANSDIVVHTASSQMLEAAKRLAAGCAKRRSQGKHAFLIHTSGSSIVADEAKGQFLAKDVYSDTDDLYAFEKKDLSYNMRQVDTALVEAGEDGSFGVSIIVPPTIYGPGTGPVKRTPHQVRMIITAAIKFRQTNYVGAGLSAWTHVHIDDLAALYVRLVEAVREGTAPSGRNGYFFTETGEHTWKELSETIASVLYARGLVDSPKAVPWESEEKASAVLAPQYVSFLHLAFSSNSRIRAVRGRQLGWNPVHKTEDFFDSMGEQADFVIKEDNLVGK